MSAATTTPRASDRIVIAGAGIAGLSLALTLARHGIASRVLERREVASEAGAGIQLGPNAMHVLQRLDVARHLAPAAGRPRSIVVADGASGRRLGELPLGDWIERRHGAPYWVAHRVDLQAALLAAVAEVPSIELVMGFEVAGWQDTADGVVVQASPGGGGAGTGSAGDVACAALIGADGLWSTTRRRLFPDAKLTYSGKMAARCVIPAPDTGAPDTGAGDAAARVAAARDGIIGALTTSVGVWLGRDAHIVHYPVRAGREIALVAIVDEPVPREGWGGDIARESVLQRLQAFAPALHELIAPASGWRAWSLYDPPPLPAWSRGRVGLAGDAAHPILPFLAQGGAMAIEDAETLAAALARWQGDPAKAFEATEALRRARVIRAQDAARTNGRIYHLGGAAGLARNLALAMVPGPVMMERYAWLYGWNGDRVPPR